MHARHVITLFFSLALLLGQLAGIGHAASHLQEGDQDRPHAVCEMCIAYASLGSGASGQPMPPFGELTVATLQTAVCSASGIASRPPYASRAPPSLV